MFEIIKNWFQPRKNLTSGSLKTQKWDDENKNQSLENVFNHVTIQAQAAIDWYLDRKESKKFMAQFIRFWIVSLTAIAGLIPLLHETDFYHVSAIWSSICLAAAVAIGAYDKFYGFSGAWMRYLTAQLKIRNKLQLFRVSWEIEQAALKGETPNDEQLNDRLVKCQTFLIEVNEIVENEMQAWHVEFQATLNELDKATKSSAKGK